MTQKHDYYPLHIRIDNYVPNSLDASRILAYFFGILVVVMLAAFFMVRTNNNLSMQRQIILLWFALCGFIHTFLEGHFAIFHADIPSRMDFLSQVWKEYSKGDSRYMISDPFTVCMESITAFVEGPMCFLTVWAFVTNKPYRYLLQMAVSSGQFYGCVLYFLTEIMGGFAHGPYLHLLYFWFYFVFMNVLWIVIPFLLIVNSWRNLSAAQLSCDGKKMKSK